MDGKQKSFDDFKSSYLIIDFWYLACVPCLQSLPKKQMIYEKYRNKDVSYISVNSIDNHYENVKLYLMKHGYTFPVYFTTNTMTKLFQVSAFPTTVVLDSEHNILLMISGNSPKLEENLERVIKLSPNPHP